MIMAGENKPNWKKVNGTSGKNIIHEPRIQQALVFGSVI